jgi:hypothetical protein
MLTQPAEEPFAKIHGDLELTTSAWTMGGSDISSPRRQQRAGRRPNFDRFDAQSWHLAFFHSRSSLLRSIGYV